MTAPDLDERLLAALRRHPPQTASALAGALGVSQPTLSRALGRIADQVVVLGRARSTRYALRHSVRGMGSHFPLVRIDADGRPARLATLIALGDGGFCVQRDDGRGEYHDDLPWFVWDMRPQGFLGRALVQQHPERVFPQRWQDWSSEDILQWLVEHGSACPGNLILGESAFQDWSQDEARYRDMAIALEDRTTRYPGLANQALHGAGFGSSAGGEQPKFPAMRSGPNGGFQEVLVKFSPPTTTPAGQRWADLLVCEHLALQVLRESLGGEAAARSEILMADNRVFLEVDRFDRIGSRGRRGMVSLEAVNAEFLGLTDQTWEAAASALLARRLVHQDDHDALLLRTAFAQLIANTDRHFGNISFFMDEGQKLSLAPAYDMLPMALAPVNNEVISRQIAAPRPRTDTLACWERAQQLAARFWQATREDPRISSGFKQALQVLEVAD